MDMYMYMYMDSSGVGIREYDLESGNCVREISHNREWFHACRFNLELNKLVSGWKTIHLWELSASANSSSSSSPFATTPLPNNNNNTNGSNIYKSRISSFLPSLLPFSLSFPFSSSSPIQTLSANQDNTGDVINSLEVDWRRHKIIAAFQNQFYIFHLKRYNLPPTSPTPKITTTN